MKKNIAKMNYTELNERMIELDAQVEELNRRLAELSVMKEELEAEIKDKKQKVIANYVLHVNKLMELTREMGEMGIDPTSIPMEEFTTGIDTVPASDAGVENKVTDSFNSIDSRTTKNVEEHNVEIVETCSAPEPEELDNTSSKSEEDDIAIEFTGTMKPEGKLLTPFYQVWGLRKGEFPKTCGGPKWKHNSPRLHTPFETLCKGPVNKCMNMGNLQYRESCAIPTESRIFSADGIAPTLTKMHSDIMVRIGNDPHSLTAA